MSSVSVGGLCWVGSGWVESRVSVELISGYMGPVFFGGVIPGFPVVFQQNIHVILQRPGVAVVLEGCRIVPVAVRYAHTMLILCTSFSVDAVGLGCSARGLRYFI